MIERTFVKVAVVVAVLCFVGAPVVVAEGDCRAHLTSEMVENSSGSTEEGEGAYFLFTVTVTTEEECAQVDFRLEATIETADNEEVRYKPGRVRVSDGEVQQNMRYQLKPGESLADWKIVQTKCEPCTLNR
jgi:hypothetical protein